MALRCSIADQIARVESQLELALKLNPRLTFAGVMTEADSAREVAEWAAVLSSLRDLRDAAARPAVAA